MIIKRRTAIKHLFYRAITHFRLRALAAQAIDDQTWIAILKGLAEEAQYGNVRCAELLMNYAFGVTASVAKDTSRAAAPAAQTRPASTTTI